jgi:hypothetical protein
VTRRPADLARDGDLDAIFALTREGRDRDAYKWLSAALDFGHDDDDLVGDVLETTSMRFDDSGFERGAAHWELAVAYLEGDDGLPRDLALAAAHLDEVFSFGPGRPVLASINAGTSEAYDAEAVLARLDGDARALLERKLAGDRAGRVRYLVERVERLREVRAPAVIIDAEASLLRDALAEVDDAELAARARKALDG